MLEIGVVVDPETLDQSGNLITGTIYLQVGQQAFPEKGWNDNIAIVLSWWLDNMANGRSTFDFMEGPCSFKVNRSELELMANRKVQVTYPVIWPELEKSIAKAAECVILHLKSKNCTHQNFTELENKYSLKRDWLS